MFCLTANLVEQTYAVIVEYNGVSAGKVSKIYLLLNFKPLTNLHYRLSYANDNCRILIDL